jgi:RNA polymerase sigma-70 factor, ECF subfamily
VLQGTDERDDQQLVAALNAGDVSAFDALYYRYRDWVMRLAFRFTANQDDALDVLQETFAYLFGKFPGFILTARMTTFLYPVVKNLSLAARRKRNRLQSDDLALDAAPAPIGAKGASAEDLAVLVQALPEIQREVLLMRFLDDMSMAEIAGALAIPEGTVKSRLHHAIQALKADQKVKEFFS